MNGGPIKSSVQNLHMYMHEIKEPAAGSVVNIQVKIAYRLRPHIHISFMCGHLCKCRQISWQYTRTYIHTICRTYYPYEQHIYFATCMNLNI